MASRYDDFNKNFFQSSKMEIEWFDQLGLTIIDEQYVAEIYLLEKKTSFEAEGYKVKIINRDAGNNLGEPLFSHIFRFRDFLSKRIDGTVWAPNEFSVKINTNGKASWGLAVPLQEEVDDMVIKIQKYIYMCC